MPLQISIVPIDATLDLYGQPDTNAAYSLAGHVSLSFSSRLSLLDRYRTEKLLLHSLELTFEGQSELVSDGGVYSAVRVCSITKELINGEPLLITNEDVSSSASGPKKSSCRWDIVFDLPIPGWLPATSVFGQYFNDLESGTRYTLYAKATLRDLNSPKSGALPTLLCGLFKSPSRSVRASPCPIILRRLHVSPCRTDDSPGQFHPFPQTSYTVKTSVNRCMDRDFAEHELIPADVLSAIDVKVDIPESLSVFENVPITIRARIDPELDGERRKRVGIVGFKMDVQQTETYTTAINPGYKAHFPVPPESRQPPNVPLQSARFLDHYFSLGLLGPPEQHTATTLEYSLISDKLEPKSFQVADEERDLDGDGWASYSVVLDLDKNAPREVNNIGKGKFHPRGFRTIRTHYDSPLLKVRHQLVVALLCSYEHDAVEGSDEPRVAFEALNFSIPLHIVLPGSAPLFSFSSRPVSIVIPSADPYTKQTMKIPAYSQLFYPNGDPREDLWDTAGEQLPVYEKEKPLDNDNDNDSETAPLISGNDSN